MSYKTAWKFVEKINLNEWHQPQVNDVKLESEFKELDRLKQKLLWMIISGSPKVHAIHDTFKLRYIPQITLHHDIGSIKIDDGFITFDNFNNTYIVSNAKYRYTFENDRLTINSIINYLKGLTCGIGLFATAGIWHLKIRLIHRLYKLYISK